MKKIIFILTCFSLIGIKNIFAQTSSMSILPSRTEIISQSNKKINIQYQFANTSEPKFASIDIVKIKNMNNFTGDIIIDRDSQIKFNLIKCENINLREKFFIKKNQKINCHMQVEIPEKITHGDNLFLIIFSVNSPPDNESAININLNTSPASLLTLAISDNQEIDFQARVRLFKSYSPFQISLGKNFPTVHIIKNDERVKIKTILENNGKYSIKVSGIVEIKLPWRHNAQTRINFPTQLIQANQPYELKTDGATEFMTEYIDFYKLKGSIKIDQNKENLLIEQSFIIISEKFIYLTLLTIAILILIAIFYFKINKKLS